MSVYCMSDIHGQIEAFHQMLEKINFSSEDTLYIIGDVVDRGPCGIDILQEVMQMPNVTMMLGNHELMMLNYLSPDATEKQLNHGSRNGNFYTLQKYKMLDPQQQKDVLDFVKSLPDSMDITVNGHRFFLVHGLPKDNTYDSVWKRPTGLDFPNPCPDHCLIIGHTPVSSLMGGQTDEGEEAYLKELEKEGKHVEILHAPGFIDIDCTCGYSFNSCALSCLRLDDMQEYYIPVYTPPFPRAETAAL